VIKVCEGPTSAGLSNEMITYLLAFDSVKKGEGGGLEGEDIKTHTVPLEEVEEWLAIQLSKGTLVSPRIYVGLYWLQRVMKEREREA